jgi:TPR repeat protein
MRILDHVAGKAFPAVALRRAISLSASGKAAEAFPLMAAAARAGNAAAQYRVGRCYLEGSGVPPSRAEGARWLKQAADHGSSDAQALLAALALTGLVNSGDAGQAASDRLFSQDALNEPDFETALALASKAAAAGSATGQAILGYILTHGPERLRDATAAHRWYERSAAAGCAEGSLGLALSLAAKGLPEDRPQMVQELRRAADGGLPTAIYLLAVMTERGIGTTRDHDAALKLYERAAERGMPAAQYRLGLALLVGKLVNQDVESGEAWLRRAALAGNAEAAFLLGDRCAKGGRPSFAEAAIWYRRAVEGGHQGAARALASLYLTGAGVGEDPDEAGRLLRSAAECGNHAAQVDLANLVLTGAGGQDDATSIAQWFEAAASSGDRIAAFNLGLCFIKGVGVHQDEAQAARWFKQAAEGVPEGQYMYARLLLEGRGVIADAREARLWFARAGVAGVLDAQVALAEMLLNGRGGPASEKDAIMLFQRAASKGHAGAIYALGAIFPSDEGDPADASAAKTWLSSASEPSRTVGQPTAG